MASLKDRDFSQNIIPPKISFHPISMPCLNMICLKLPDYGFYKISSNPSSMTSLRKSAVPSPLTFWNYCDSEQVNFSATFFSSFEALRQRDLRYCLLNMIPRYEKGSKQFWFLWVTLVEVLTTEEVVDENLIFPWFSVSMIFWRLQKMD